MLSGLLGIFPNLGCPEGVESSRSANGKNGSKTDIPRNEVPASVLEGARFIDPARGFTFELVGHFAELLRHLQ